jgi:hypothetical protein
MEPKMKREELTELLQSNVCEVTFTKVDGTERTMPCTLKTGVVPVVESKGVKKPNDAVMSVWCTDAQGWRSFRVDNVTAVKILEN